MYMLPYDNPNNITYLLFQGLELFQADKECLLWSQKRDHLIFQTVKGYSDLAAFKKKKGRGNNRSTYIRIFKIVLTTLQNCNINTELSFLINIRIKFLYTPPSQNCALCMSNVQPYYEKKSHYKMNQIQNLEVYIVRVFFKIFQKI